MVAAAVVAAAVVAAVVAAAVVAAAVVAAALQVHLQNCKSVQHRDGQYL